MNAVKGLLPDRATAVDLGFVLVLGVVATYGLRDSYDGWSYLAAGAAGLLLGGLLAHVGNRLRLPVALVALLTVAAFFLLGGVAALHGRGVTAMLPLPDTLTTLAEQSVHGWKDLLTTLAPVDGGPLLTLPYLMGLIVGMSALTLAVRTGSAFWPVLPLLVHLGAAILLGIHWPDRILTLGAVFVATTVAWVAARARRGRSVVRGGTWRRRAIASVLVAGATASATVVAPHLPGAASHERLVLRDHVAPPFDVGQYPSPLASFRRYTAGYQAEKSRKLFDQELLTVDGLPPGSRIRFAALDSYDGRVWGASNQAPDTEGARGNFQRVGVNVNDDGPGETHHAEITIGEGYDGVWLPLAGALQELSFTGADADEQAAVFRYNLATDTGVLPRGLHAGDSYRITVRVPGASERATADMSVSGAGQSLDGSGVDFTPVANRWGDVSDSSLSQVFAIARTLRDKGAYTNGGKGEERYAAGHSLRRLSDFGAEDRVPAGDDEQYAAMLGLLATQLGVPARVVMGATVPEDGVVKGKHVRAWVELRDRSGTWRELPTEDFMSKERPPEDQQLQEQQLVSGDVVPPPSAVRPPAAAGDPLRTEENRSKQEQEDSAFTFPGWLIALLKYVALPVFLLVLLFGSIVGAKVMRRRRRRTRGAPAQRLSAAWRELVDAARDHGHRLYGGHTRREQAAQIDFDGLAGLARAADRHAFGSLVPTDDDAAAYWTEAERVRSDLRRSRTRLQRIRATVSLASFRRLPREEVGA